MICPKKVQKICLFGMMCAPECEVAEDGECADYIRKTLAELEKMQPRNTDPVEAAEVRHERFAIVTETFEGNGRDWRKDNPMLRAGRAEKEAGK